MRRTRLTSLLTAVTIAMASTLASAPASADVDAGPHAAAGRALAHTVITASAGVTQREIDLGDVDLGRRTGAYRSPVRGILVTPDRTAGDGAPLIIIAHLRAPNCVGGVFAFPCPNGKELRFDRGMAYLGVALAQRGFSALIPDLGPAYVGGYLTEPYDQRAGFRTIVGQLTSAVVRADSGETTRFGSGLRGKIDTSRVGIVAHSRSAYMVGDLVRAWAGTATPIASAMVYGGAYDVEYFGASGTTPMVPDIPFLGIVGGEDRDTDHAGALWLTDRIGAARRNPALMVTVPGFGHDYINRTLALRQVDDRICEIGCASPEAHLRLMRWAAVDWFTATLRGYNRMGLLPIDAASPMPPTFEGLKAHWLAVTSGPRSVAFLAGSRGALQLFGAGGAVRTCYPPEPMAPSRANPCPFPDRGVSQIASRIAQITVAPRGGVRLATRPTRGVREVVLQLAPTGDRADGRPGSPLTVTAQFAHGGSVTRTIAPSDPAVVDRATTAMSGTYSIGTVRLRLPAWVAERTLVGVTLTGGPTTSHFDVRAIDLVTTAQ